MKKLSIRGVVAGLVGLGLLLGGVATASNMGFKFVPNVGANQFFNLSLPWNNNYTKANGLFNDIKASAPTVGSVSKVQTNGKSLDWFAGAPPANNYTVAKGEAYVVKAGSGGINSFVLVGSHDPNYTFSFAANQYFNAAAPYHQTFTKVNQLFNDLKTKLGANAIATVSKVQTNGKKLDWFNGAPPANNYNLDLGMGVIMKANTGGSGYVWPHY